MDQLVKTISEKTGISEEQSRTAVTEVIKYVKGYLPPQVSGYVDTFLGGGAPSGTATAPTGTGAPVSPTTPSAPTPSTSPGTPTNPPGGIDDLMRGVDDMFGSPTGSKPGSGNAPMISKPQGSGNKSDPTDTTTPGSSGSASDIRAV